MNNPLLEILIIFLLLVLNGVFAMAEISIVSARRARLQQLANEGDRRAAIALKLSKNPEAFLATIQTGITLIGVLAGAFSGATIGRELGALLNQLPAVAPYGEPLAVGLVVIVVTYLSLVIGELFPKQLALTRPERIALLTAPPLHTLSQIARPAVWLLTGSTRFLMRFLRIRPSREPSITEEELKVLLDQGTQVGVFDEVEQDMIERVLFLDKRRINTVMTPRPQIDWLDINAPSAKIFAQLAESLHSRLPVCDNELDNVLGIVFAKDLLGQTVSKRDFDIRQVLRPPLFVPESIFIVDLLELLKEEKSHLALVTDEFGSIEGLITPIDILETIVGDIPTQEEVTIDDLITRREDGSFLVDGFTHVDQLKDLLGVKQLPQENRLDIQTVGGFFVHQLGSIPEVGQSFEWHQVRFEVVDMDGRRVDKVLITLLEEAEDA